ncbi:MAG: hypothetical protein KBC33_02285 [Candidatus Pacebacteria bacterium]|nr:hypothetical protein [Candidatus Paceibacterota bacterium]
MKTIDSPLKRMYTAACICLLIAFIMTTPASRAETFYLASKCKEKVQLSPPLPGNQYPGASLHRVIPDESIWVINDCGMTEKEIGDIVDRVATHITEVRILNALEELNKPVKQPVVIPTPRPAFTNFYNRTNMNIGAGIALMETMRPGISTNFTKEQRAVRTNETLKTKKMQMLPPHIRKSNPEYKKLLHEFMQERKQQQPKEEKQRGQGDGAGEIFEDTSFFAIHLKTLAAPTPQKYPLWDGTNLTIWQQFKPGVSRYSQFVGGTNVYTDFKDSTDVELIESPFFNLALRYPDTVAREVNHWPCAEVNFYGFCDYGTEFDVTNRMHMLPYGVSCGWDVAPDPFCSMALPHIVLVPISMNGPDDPPFFFPTPQGDPHIQKPFGQPPRLQIQSGGPSFSTIEVQETGDLASTASSSSSMMRAGQMEGLSSMSLTGFDYGVTWTHVTNATTDATGMMRVELPMTSDSRFYRVIGTKTNVVD